MEQEHLIFYVCYGANKVKVKRYLGDLKQKALDHFTKKYKINSETGCWDWIATTIISNKQGMLRPTFMVEKKRWLAHRWAYQHFIGELPPKMLVCHSCDNTLCVNPKHLWLGTYMDNVRDCINKGRHAFQKYPHPISGKFASI